MCFSYLSVDIASLHPILKAHLLGNYSLILKNFRRFHVVGKTDDAIKHIRYGPDWAGDVITPETQVFTDIENGNLAQVSWVVPALANSDHAGPRGRQDRTGLGCVDRQRNRSQQVLAKFCHLHYMGRLGWMYDRVPPPQIEEMGLGFRVPLIVVSPYARRGYISHQQHEFGSLLNLTEELFNLPSLGTRDAISDDFRDCFDFYQPVLTYVPVQTNLTHEYFKHQVPTGPPDTD